MGDREGGIHVLNQLFVGDTGTHPYVNHSPRVDCVAGKERCPDGSTYMSICWGRRELLGEGDRQRAELTVVQLLMDERRNSERPWTLGRGEDTDTRYPGWLASWLHEIESEVG